MLINAVGPGRRGTLDQGVGKLTLTAEYEHEHFKLRVLGEEMVENLGFWTAMMWALRECRVMTSDVKVFARIIDEVRDEFSKLSKERKPRAKKNAVVR